MTTGIPAVYTPSTGIRDLTLAKALAQGVRVVPGIVEVATGGARVCGRQQPMGEVSGYAG